jgi:hypothetical protein
MWIKFINDYPGTKKDQVVWSTNKSAGQWLIDNGYALRCLSAEGIPEGYFAPEDIIGAYAKEDGVTFEEEELILKQKRIFYGNKHESLTTAESNKIKDKMPKYYNKDNKKKPFTSSVDDVIA